MEIVEQPPGETARTYMRLFRRCRRSRDSSCEFARFARSLVTGKLLYLNKRFHQRTLFLFKDGHALAALVAFLPGQDDLPHCIGGILADETLSVTELHGFFDEALHRLPATEFLLPLNGHMNFGISAPLPRHPGGRIGFLTTSRSPATDALASYGSAEVERRYLALETIIDAPLASRLRRELAEMPAGFSTRPLSLTHFKRDLSIHNELTSVAMAAQAHFAPMADDENWDLMRNFRLFVSPALCQFLLYEGREVGFCLGVLDFNEILRPEPDWSNAMRSIAGRHRIRRGRIFASGILPAFRGQKVFKYIRNKVLLAFLEKGVAVVESSYVDEANDNSLGNVLSRGARVSHEFALYRTKAPAGAAIADRGSVHTTAPGRREAL
jgi:hypothetical protein